MKVDLIGCGCGSLTRDAQEALSGAEFLIGSARLLRAYGEGRPCAEAVTAEAILQAARASGCEKVAVLLSGDSGFYSGARLLQPLLEGCETHVLPGISSVQTLAARLGRPWQGWRLCSAHGTECDVLDAVCGGRPAFFLTGGKTGAAEICRILSEAGLGELRTAVGEELGTENERITEGFAREMAVREFSPLSVLLCQAAPRPARRAPGLPDAAFERLDGVPMTKQTVRAAVLAKLAVGPNDLCWDIGAGTGSVSVELALQARAVHAVEREGRALALAERNRIRHGAWNLRLHEGTAPEALKGLPAPDAVFIGGSGGKLRGILTAVLKANPAARICVSAIALETLEESVSVLGELGCETEVSQIAVSGGKKAGPYTLMTAHNPVWLILGEKA